MGPTAYVFSRGRVASCVLQVHARRRGLAAPLTSSKSEARRDDYEPKAELAAWERQHGKLIDPSAFEREILPLIQNVPLSRLARASGLSLRYISQIRRGERVPHPRHWAAFRHISAI